MNVEKNPYADIIHLPHHKAPNRPHMSLYDRAAQFSPFAALTGFDSVIAETARLTDRKVELSESEKILLDQKLTMVRRFGTRTTPTEESCGAVIGNTETAKNAPRLPSPRMRSKDCSYRHSTK